MTAVAVWEHEPSAEELLAARLAAGWRPTPSHLVAGLRVLGQAANVARDLWTKPGVSSCALPRRTDSMR